MSDDEQDELIENTGGPGFVGIQFCQEWCANFFFGL